MKKISNFSKWNEDMYKKYGNEDRYKSKNPFIKYNTLSRLRSIQRLIPANKDILELGCGAGMVLRDIESYSSIVGVDLSKTALVEAKRNLKGKKRVKLIHGDVQKVNLKKKFDVIICAETLEHLPNPSKVLDVIKKHCKKDAHIIITVPNEKNIQRVDNVLNIFSNKRVKMDWHIHEFDIELFKKFNNKRFTIQRVIKTPTSLYPISYTILCRP